MWLKLADGGRIEGSWKQSESMKIPFLAEAPRPQGLLFAVCGESYRAAFAFVELLSVVAVGGCQ